jgi:hypothetical protein
VSLQLYELIKDRTDNLPALGLSREVQELVGVSFSLWRAVFLADRAEDETRSEHAATFLAKMLTDNAIAFTQDRENREWTFNYYLDNAFFRLEQLGKDWTGTTALEPPATEVRTRRRRWNFLHNAFKKAVKRLKEKLEEAENSN